MNQRNYTKDVHGNTLIGRPRSPGETELVEPVQRKNAFAVDRDASTFPLATSDACIASLRSLYGTANKEVELMIMIVLFK
jgi:hypothetical protein